MTRLGTYLEQIDAPYSAWQAASSNFANVASNSSNVIYSIQNVVGVGLQSVWASIITGQKHNLWRCISKWVNTNYALGENQ